MYDDVILSRPSGESYSIVMSSYISSSYSMGLYTGSRIDALNLCWFCDTSELNAQTTRQKTIAGITLASNYDCVYKYSALRFPKALILSCSKTWLIPPGIYLLMDFQLAKSPSTSHRYNEPSKSHRFRSTTVWGTGSVKLGRGNREVLDLEQKAKETV